MTYQIVKGDDESTVENADGEEIATLDHPITAPDDIIDAILDDMGVGEPQKEAFSVLLKKDWEIIDPDES